jgi:hypothetical protein
MASPPKSLPAELDDFDINNLPAHWKKTLKEAGVRKKDLKDPETRKMVRNNSFVWRSQSLFDSAQDRMYWRFYTEYIEIACDRIPLSRGCSLLKEGFYRMQSQYIICI